MENRQKMALKFSDLLNKNGFDDYETISYQIL